MRVEFVTFPDLNGGPVAINPQQVRLIRAGTSAGQTAILFEENRSVIVQGAFEDVVNMLTIAD